MTITLPAIELGTSGIAATKITLGTMTFGEQVNEADSFAIMDRAVERGVTMFDAAEMYPVPPNPKTYGVTETILGNWFTKRPGMRRRLVLATKVAGPARGMPWIRDGADITPAGIAQACDASLKRLRADVIDLYQIHWPNRNVPMFGGIYLDPTKDSAQPATSIHDQLDALGKLVKAGKVRAIGLSNETPYGVMAFVHAAEQHGLPRVATVQNPYALTSRALDNGLDEVLRNLNVSMLAYSPLAFGVLTGKYDEKGIEDPDNAGRMARFERFKQQRWARPQALAAAKRYGQLARDHGMTPTRLALAWCYQNWRVASTIIGVTSLAQLDECLDAWQTRLAPELLAAIDQIRQEIHDPAQ